MTKPKLPATIAMVACLAAVPMQASAADKTGIALFQEHCATCHVKQPDSPRQAPPIFAVKNHYLPTYADKASFTKAVAAWLKAPAKERSLMPGAIRRFELMPPVEVSDADARKIAEFIYDAKFDVPGWYRQHYRQQHGKDPVPQN